jgi:hypothetical protein
MEHVSRSMLCTTKEIDNVAATIWMTVLLQPACNWCATGWDMMQLHATRGVCRWGHHPCLDKRW